MNKLIAKDLMVGDWFNFLIDIEGGHTEYDPKNEIYQPMQVRDITSFGINDGEVSSYEGVVNDIAQLQPIPITSELLEKNFTYNPYGIYFFDDDYLEVSIKEYTDGLWRVEVDEIEMSSLPTWRMFVSNVHELQHALRLAGIDKEIKL